MIEYVKNQLNDDARILQVYGFLRFFGVLLFGVILVKSTYSVSDVSVFESYLFIAGSLSYFVSNALNRSLVTINDKFDSVSSMAINYIAMGLSSGIAVLIAQFSGLNPLVMGLLVLSIPLGNALEYSLIVQSRRRVTLFIGVIFFLLTILGFLFLAAQNRDIIFFIYWLIFMNAVKSLAFLVSRNKTKSKNPLQSNVYINFLLIALLAGCMDYVDGYLVKYLFPDFEFGIYRYGSRELPLFTIIIFSISNAFVLKIHSESETWKSQLKDRISALLNWSTPILILLFFVSPFLFEYFFSSSYSQSAHFFNIYLLIFLTRVFLGQSVLMAYGKISELRTISIIEILVNIFASIILAKFMGIEGILWATILAFIVEKCLIIFEIRKLENIAIGDMFPIKKYALFSIFTLTAYCISTLL